MGESTTAWYVCGQTTPCLHIGPVKKRGHIIHIVHMLFTGFTIGPADKAYIIFCEGQFIKGLEFCIVRGWIPLCVSSLQTTGLGHFLSLHISPHGFCIGCWRVRCLTCRRVFCSEKACCEPCFADEWMRFVGWRGEATCYIIHYILHGMNMMCR